MAQFFKLVSGFVADQNGNGSRKAITLYASLYLLYIMIKASFDSKPINEYLLFSVLIIILFCLGAITTEWVTKNWKSPTQSPTV